MRFSELCWIPSLGVFFQLLSLPVFSQQTIKEYVYLGSRLLATETNSLSTSISPAVDTVPYSAGTNKIFIYASSGTSWTATTPTAWIHLSSPSGSGNGSVVFTFDANTTGAARTGIISVGLLSETITQLASPVGVPTNISFNANPVSGADSTFTFTFSSPGGPAFINWFQGIINSNLSTVQGCNFIYGATEDVLTLGSGQAPPAAPWIQSGRPGSTGSSLDNGFCKIDLASVTKTMVNSTTMSLRMNVHFYSVMQGTQYVWMFLGDNAGQNNPGNWEWKGTYVPYVPQLPSVGAVGPNGTGTSATFTAEFIDPNGATALTDMFIMISPTNTPTVDNSCWTYYNSGFYLMTDTTRQWQGAPRSNSQCTLSSAGSSITRVNNKATMAVNVTFSSAYAGTRYIFVWAQDNLGNNTGWVAGGTWTIPSAGPQVVVSVVDSQNPQLLPPFFMSPGDSKQFTASVTGSTNTAVNWSLSSTAGPGSINYAPNGNNVTLQVSPFQFVPQVVTLTATSMANSQSLGQVTINLQPSAALPYFMNAAPTNVLMTRGTNNTFTFSASDTGGALNVKWIQPLLTWNPPLSFYGVQSQAVPFGCHMWYDRASNVLYLDNEGGNNYWVDSAVVGQPHAPLTNSVCSVDVANSTVVPTGNTLQLNLKITLTGSFPTPYEYNYVSSANNAFDLFGLFLGWWNPSSNPIN